MGFQQTTPAGLDRYGDNGSNINRHSGGSNMNDQRNSTARPENELPPPSRGTEFTDQDDRFTMTISPTGNPTAQSIGESERPLHGRSADLPPSNLDQGKSYKHGLDALGPIERSPRSFRASFLIPSKSGTNARSGAQGRQRLGSVVGSSKAVDTKPAKQGASRAGVNYQYFEGNTVFCWGGRLQNTRDRPVNIGTAIVVVLPSLLFFAYS